MTPRSAATRIVLAACLLATAAAAGPTAEWGPFVEEIVSHLALEMTREAADRLVERLSRTERTPVLQLNDQQIQQMMKEKIDSELAECVRRAQVLDEYDPARPYPSLKLPAGWYEHELDAYRKDCARFAKAD
jgi:hypothetical protein